MECYLPNIRRVLSPTLFPASLARPGPKHSTSVPFSVKVAVALSVDEKEIALVPNPVSGVAVKPHADTAPVVICARIHSLLPFTLQMVTPFMSPVTVHLKVKVSPGQAGGAAVNCAAVPPGEKSAWKTFTSSLGTQLDVRGRNYTRSSLKFHTFYYNDQP